MLAGMYRWIRSLAGYFLFLAVLEQILPDKSYSRYVRLFAGMIMILLVVQPLADAAMLTDRIAQLYEELELRYDTEYLQEDILGVENQQYNRLIAEYEQAISADITQMAADEGYEAVSCQAVIDKDRESGTFGSVILVKLKLRSSAGGADEESRTPAHTVSYLQKRISSYYHLEESYVEIQMSERQG